MLIILQLLISLIIISHYSSLLSLGSQLCLHHECEALLAFTAALVDDSYYPTVISSWKKERNCCKWGGVTCDPETGHVTDLDLAECFLAGSLPSNSTLFFLSHLRRLNLAYNDFSSPIPSYFGRLSSLTHLNLSNSGFSGEVPTEIGWLSRLTTLDLSLNYDVTMPNFKTIVANLTDLRELNLSYVRIDSNMPLIIANLSKLESLGLRRCCLQGEFPATTVLGLPKLRILQMAENSVHADFSASLVQWRSPLEVVDVSNCYFTGKLSNFIGESSNFSLRSLDIEFCRFYGEIPNWIWNGAEEIRTDGNGLSGSLPTTMNTTKLARLSILDLTKNKISGMIPAWMFTLPSLKSLKLDLNLFTGLDQSAISNISTISSLVEFSASFNNLEGHIPDIIFALHNLQLLDLEGNNLTGSIPLISKLHNLRQLDILRLSRNNLTIIDDYIGTEMTAYWPKLSELGISSCNIGHFPGFLKEQENLTILELSNNGIHGPIPEWFFDTSRISMLILDLSVNSLTGGFENLRWQIMDYLDISHNMIEGFLPFPSSISSLYASNNRFTGEIPSSFCDTGFMFILDLSHNNLTGKIPNCFFNLDTIDLQQNQLEGTIPSGYCGSLSTLNLGSNLFEGSIPHSMVNCTKLQFLHLGDNKLNGTFPQWLGVLPCLEILILGSNHLKGPLMSSNITNIFTRLHILDVSNNHLTGELPCDLFKSMYTMIDVSIITREWGDGKDLIYYGQESKMMTWIKGFKRQLDEISMDLVLIDVSNNRFEGHIPELIGDLVSMRWLNLAHNNFTGSIPSSFANLSLLESLDLSFNRLDGQIPGQLVNLNSLEYFNVTENCLVGPVPTSKQFSTFSDNSYFGNPGLCGEFLTKKCKTKVELPKSTPAEDSGGFESPGIHEWEIVLMGVGCGLLVGSVWGYLIFWERNYYWVTKLIFMVEIATMHCRRC